MGYGYCHCWHAKYSPGKGVSQLQCCSCVGQPAFAMGVCLFYLRITDYILKRKQCRQCAVFSWLKVEIGWWASVLLFQLVFGFPVEINNAS